MTENRIPIEIFDAPETLFYPRCDGQHIEVVISTDGAVITKTISTHHAVHLARLFAACAEQMLAKA